MFDFDDETLYLGCGWWWTQIPCISKTYSTMSKSKKKKKCLL